MCFVVLLSSCLAIAAIASPIPQQQEKAQQYFIRRPDNSVSLHSQARQIQNNPANAQFTVKLEDSIERPDHLVVGAQANIPEHRGVNANAPPTGPFTVALESAEFSAESIEVVCPNGQWKHGTRCVVPRINRNIFVFGKDRATAQPKAIIPVEKPIPEIDYNIIFVRSQAQKAPKPLIIPPPIKKTVVYVLEDEAESRETYNSPVHDPIDPEVFYVKVRDGENPQLPGGLDLATAYSQAIRPDLDDDFESSLEFTIGSGTQGLGSVGISLPSSGSARGSSQGTQTANAGAGVGIPLPTIQGNSAATQTGLNNQANFGIPLSNFQGNSGASPARSDNLGSIGVALPSFNGNSGASIAGLTAVENVGVALPNFSANSGSQATGTQNQAGVGIPLPLNTGFGGDSGLLDNLGLTGDSFNLGSGFSGKSQTTVDNNLAASNLLSNLGPQDFENAMRHISQALRYQTPI